MLTRRLKKRIKLLCAALLFFPFLSGCWDRQEIEERANILGIAIDAAPASAVKSESEVSHLQGKFPIPTKSMIKITAQIAVPGRIPLGPESGGGAGGKHKPVWVLSKVGHTVEDALMNLQQEIADRLFFGHLRMIIVSEKIALQGVKEITDYWRRNPEVRRTAWLLVSKGEASTLLETSPQLERVPMLYLSAMMEHAVTMGKFPNDFLGIFWSASSSKGRDPYLPLVEVKKGQNVEIAGLAYFTGDKMVGSLKPLEIGFVMAVMGVKKGGYTAFIPVPGVKGTVLVRSNYRTSKTDVTIKNGIPHVMVRMQVEGDINEKSGENFNLYQDNLLKKIEMETEKRGKKAIKDLIKKTQKDGSDIFGFGEHVRAKLPFYWNEHVRSKHKWEEMYKKVTVDILFRVKLRRIGMKAR